MSITLRENMTILFQGDSITDCYRNEIEWNPMGCGYASIVAALLQAHYPKLNLNSINRGVSGNVTADLLRRWKNDCLILKPDVVSILIGINNTWFYSGIRGNRSDDSFYFDYLQILQMTRDVFDTVELVLCEPFLLQSTEEVKRLRHDVNEKVGLVHELAEKFRAIVVPFDAMFTQASHTAPPSYWAPDGVHPTPAGHALMAKEWIKCVVANPVE